MAVGLVAATLLFAAVILSFTRKAEGPTQSAKQVRSAAPVVAGPVTPDTAADALVAEALADEAVLGAESDTLLSDLQAEADSVNDLTTVYDENEN